MSRRPSPRRSDGLTGELFSNIPKPAPEIPGSMDYRCVVAGLVNDMLAEAKAYDPLMERPMVAALVSRLTGKEVSRAMLDAYTAESRDTFNAPAYLMPALETVCKSTLYTSWIASVRGGRLVLGPEALDAEIGRIQSELSDHQERLRELRHLRRSIR